MASGGDKGSDFYAVLELKKECSSVELRNGIRIGSLLRGIRVLSDNNKRFLYDVGVYDCNDDEDNNGMGDFLNEMATMMNQTKPEENGNETLEELQELFNELFESDIDAFASSARPSMPPMCASSSSASGNGAYGKRNSSEMKPANFEGFCLGTSGKLGKHSGGESNRKKNPKMSRR